MNHVKFSRVKLKEIYKLVLDIIYFLQEIDWELPKLLRLIALNFSRPFNSNISINIVYIPWISNYNF